MHKNRKTKTLMAVLVATSMTVTSVVNSFSIVKAQEDIKENPSKVVEVNANDKNVVGESNSEKDKAAENNTDKKQESNSIVNNVTDAGKDGVEEEQKTEVNKEEHKAKIQESINKLRNYYDNKEMEYLEAMAYGHSSEDFEKNREFLQTKVKNVNNKNAMNCFKGIFIANVLGKESCNFDLGDGTVLNYVEGMLSKYNKVKHNFYSQDDTNARCILALDMAGVDYNKEEVIKALIDNFDKNKNINKAAVVLTTLSRHRDLAGVEEGIQKYKGHLKSLQQDDGGFGESGNGITNYYPPASAISEVIQALIALGEDPLSEEWTKNGKTMLDALMQYQTMEDGTFSINKNIGLTMTTNDNATKSAFAALADLYKGKSMYEGFKNGEVKPEPKPEEKVKVAAIDVLIDGTKIEDTLDMKVGESKSLVLEIKDEKGKKIEYAKTEIKIEGQLVALQDERINAIKEGTEKVIIKCNEIEKTIIINIKKEEVKPEPKFDSETLNKLRKYYSNSTKEMEYLETMAYGHSSNDINNDREFLQTKIKNASNNQNAMNCFKGIFIANVLGKESCNFDLGDGTVLNYVEGMLSKYNKVKHNFYSQDDTNARCILALDMAGVDYNKEEVIKTLIDNFDKNKNINKAAVVLTTLSKHRDLPGVEEGIQKYKGHLKSLQQDDGGFGESGNGITNYYPPASAISEVIQALIALGEDPLSEEWTKNGKTMLDALMQYQTMEDGTFSINKNIGLTMTTNDNATRSAFAALADLYKGKSMYEGFKNGEIKPEPKPEEKVKVAAIDVLIDGNKVEDTLDMKVGESKSLVLEIKDEKGNKIEDAKTEIKIEGQLVALQDEKITAIKEGTEKLIIRCNEIEKTIIINIKKEEVKPEPKPEPEEILDRKEIVSKTIKEIKEHYKGLDRKYNYLETLGLIFSGTDKDEIRDKVKIYDYDSIKCVEENILAIKAIGEDPTNYNGKNYVDLLLNPKEHNYNDNYANVRARRILALDMAEAEYNKEKDIKELMEMATDDGEIVFCGKEQKYNTADISLIVTAIANHREIAGVQEFIEKYKKYVNKVQLDNASFKNEYGSESCGDLCSVIQALIAIGENPTSTKWSKTDKNGNKITLIDTLLKYKDGNQFKSNNDTYSSVSDIYTERALAALADTLNEKSMYTNIGKQKINIKNIVITSEGDLKEVDLNKTLQLSAKVFDDLDNEILNKELIWESSNKDIATVDGKGLVNSRTEGNVKITAKLKEDESIKATFNIQVVDNKKAFSVEVLNSEGLKNGEDARISIKAKSNIKSEKEVNIIVALYNNSNEKMVCYSCSKKSVKAEKDEIINTGFSIPKEGEFIVKILVWDNLEDGNSYCEPIMLNVGK